MTISWLLPSNYIGYRRITMTKLLKGFFFQRITGYWKKRHNPLGFIWISEILHSDFIAISFLQSLEMTPFPDLPHF
jgi:hypothetical protein